LSNSCRSVLSILPTHRTQMRFEDCLQHLLHDQPDRGFQLLILRNIVVHDDIIHNDLVRLQDLSKHPV
jgi:hypothetical protein